MRKRLQTASSRWCRRCGAENSTQAGLSGLLGTWDLGVGWLVEFWLSQKSAGFPYPSQNALVALVLASFGVAE